MNRRILVTLCVLMLALSVAPAAAKDLQVGFVYVSPIGDAGWSYAHDQGRLYIDKMDGVTTAFVEAVPEGPDSERVMLNIARQNSDLIFDTSLGYMDPMLQVA
ncbi:MAG: BMP family ABC transporter substrate-binding protein, partial [Desulfosarcina sp.]|nr:BMP family ABC transporter substrate-binding protein [Desulfobacterales bacterium]